MSPYIVHVGASCGWVKWRRKKFSYKISYNLKLQPYSISFYRGWIL